MKTTFFIEAVRACVETQTDAPIIAVKADQGGFYPVYTRAKAARLNPADMTPEILDSAVAGSMFGWHVPAAALARAYAYEQEKRAAGKS